MRGSDNRVPFLAAIFMALLLAAMPGTVQAQNNGSTFDASTCVQNQINSYTNKAQGVVANQAKIYNAATKPDMKLVYCWDTVKTMFNTIGTMTSGSSLFGSAIWQLLQSAISSFLNSICQAVVGAIQSGINMLKSLLCIPLPHFNLGMSGMGGFSLGGFGGGNCNGVSLLSLGGNAAATRQSMPNGYSPLWNYTPSFSP